MAAGAALALFTGGASIPATAYAMAQFGSILGFTAGSARGIKAGFDKLSTLNRQNIFLLASKFIEENESYLMAEVREVIKKTRYGIEDDLAQVLKTELASISQAITASGDAEKQTPKEAIKAASAINQINETVFNILQKAPSGPIADIGGIFERAYAEEHVFRELEVLKDYYNRRITLSDKEISDVLRITGEYGSSLTDRLGLQQTSSLEEIRQVAQKQIAYWNARADTVFGCDNQTRKAARIIASSYSILAQEHR